MGRTFFLIFIVFVCFSNLKAQSSNESESSQWQTKDFPQERYWQQDVHYRIKASLNEKTHVLSGEQTLIYTNNSPDTLYELYFHLYQRAFQPGSYMEQRYEQRGYDPRFNHNEIEEKTIVVESASIDSNPIKYSIDNTLLMISLEKPLLPGSKTSISMIFKSYFNVETGWRRMRGYVHNGFTHYNGAHWYPRISVYDRKFGWTADQHLGHEFYGDFGTYEVELEMPNNIVLDATGVLLNREEVLPKSLRQKLDIKNFKDKEYGSNPSIIIPNDSTKRKVWRFEANDVHDFAFVADPTFRIGTEYVILPSGKKVECVALVEEEHASSWQDAASTAADIIAVYSRDFGEYAYPKIIVADARSGMEYPMLTMDDGKSPEYKYLFAHEIGHNWFFGAVGSNETYRSALDEGFTQFLTVWYMERVVKEMEEEDCDECNQFAVRNSNIRYTAVYERYIRNTLKEGGEYLNTHSDYFQNTSLNNEYRQVYYKSATMLFNLQYVLGDSLFQAAMQNYYEEWRFRHPYLSDFRNSIIHFTHVDLNWFFDQWLNTKKTIDYKVCSVKKVRKEDAYKITFKRKGEMQMPLDFQVMTYDSVIYNYHIPNTDFVKRTEAIVLPKWWGWNAYNSTYTAEIRLDDQIKKVQIDTSVRMADINMVDNSKGRANAFYLDNGKLQPEDWQNYVWMARPELWYNGYDGLKAGITFSGSYLNYHHIFDATLWLNTGLVKFTPTGMEGINDFEQASYRINYKNHTDRFIPYSNIEIHSRHLDGLTLNSIKLTKENRIRDRGFYLKFKSFYRRDSSDLNYLMYPDQWTMSPNTSKEIYFNNTLSIGYFQKFKNASYEVMVKTSAFGSAYNFSLLSAEGLKDFKLDKFVLRSRAFLQYGFGSDIPIESQLFLSGANPEEMMEDKFVRSYGFFPQSSFGKSPMNYQSGGGLNLRAYAAYIVPVTEGPNQVYAYRGNSGAAINMELNFGEYLVLGSGKYRKYVDLEAYLFADAGVISYSEIGSNLEFANLRADAGLGFVLSINQFGSLTKAKPLQIRFDMPFYVSHIPYVENDNFAFRWLIAVGRSF